MKLVIATPYFWPALGGLEHYAEQIARGLNTAGHEVHIITSGAVTETVTHEGLTIHRLTTQLMVSNTPISFRWTSQIRRLLRDIQPDVINVHAPVPSLAIATWLAAGSTPLVVTYHTGSMKKGSLLTDAMIGLYETLVLPRLLKRANRIIAASEFVQNRFLARWVTKTIVITPGVDTNRFTPATNRRADSPVVFVGDSRDPRKGLHILLEAMKRLPKLELRVIGPSHPTRQNGVIFTGPKTGTELVTELQGARLLVLPSTTQNESFGMVLVEAMACGLPVIGSRIGGIPTVIADGVNGLLVPASDTEALAAAIKQLSDDPAQAKRLGETGRQTVLRSYQWDQRVTATQNVFEEVSRV
jgi:glycosyltransferase involved in cell wall biosynthesis